MTGRDVVPRRSRSGVLPAVEGAAAALVGTSGLLCWLYVLDDGGPYGGPVFFALLLSPATLLLLLLTAVLRVLGRRSRNSGRALAACAALLASGVAAVVTLPG